MSFYLSPFRCLAVAASIIPAALVTGCGIGAATSAPTPLAAFSGDVHGGPNPVIGATVTLYATQTAAYGAGSLQLAQTTTDASGFFTFPTPAACPAGQQAYVTVAGGNTGGNTNNPNSLLMAAIGPCANLTGGGHLFISEATTVAAGYALSNFIGITGTTVRVSAPATNNALLPACTGAGPAMVCTAAGLAHAFQNAANLANAFSPTGAPSGQAYTTTPGNTNGIVPTLLINTLANILQTCVNSNGGAAGDSSNCGKLFTNTTPPATSTNTPVTPTNTLQAVVNLAKFPTMNSTQIAALYGLVAPQTFFNPTLTAAPSDFSLAIAYTGPTSSTNFVYDFFTVLDYADTSYTFSEAGNGTGFGPVTVASMSSNGATGYKSAAIGNALCTAGNPCAAGVDTLGHLWLANTNSSANNNVYEINTNDGSLAATFALPSGTAANSAAVDKFNTVFVTSANITAPNLYVKAITDSAFTALSAASAPVAETSAPPEYIAIDGAGSIWNTNFTTTAGSTALGTYVQNTGTALLPAYANSPVAISGSAAVTSAESVSIDASNNGWYNNQTTLYQVPPGAATPSNVFAINGTGGASATAKNATSARFTTLDGDGNIILPDNQTTSTVWQFYVSTGKFVFMAPCLGNTGTACNSATGTARLISSRNAVTDSTGSVWISNPVAAATSATAGSLVQLIGTAAPTWGQLSYGRPGVRP